MRLLLDENLPKQLKKDFPNHEIYTVRDMKWNGKKNGELLKLLLENNFNALLTFDRNIQHQQNFSQYPIAVFVLNAYKNTYNQLTPLSSFVNEYLSLDQLPIGSIVIELD